MSSQDNLDILGDILKAKMETKIKKKNKIKTPRKIN